MKICYAIDPYQGHARVAADYCRILRQKYDVVTSGFDDAADADIIILHLEPHNYEAIYNLYPALTSRYVISYCTWEADILPDSYVRSLSYVQEIWTCSRYCCEVLSGYHPRVFYLPHVVARDMTCLECDRERVKACIAYDPECFYFLTITKIYDRRKNVDGLIRSFRRFSREMPKARLVVKASPQDQMTWAADDQIIFLGMQMTNAEINALYEAANVCVSAHHSEGWGLTLSDAMLFGKPVIATNYSGNLEFMTRDNSYLVECQVGNVKAEDCFHLFDERMKWAYIDEQDMGKRMFALNKSGAGKETAAKVARAFQDVSVFSYQAVGDRLHTRMREIIEARQR